MTDGVSVSSLVIDTYNHTGLQSRKTVWAQYKTVGSLVNENYSASMICSCDIEQDSLFFDIRESSI